MSAATLYGLCGAALAGLGLFGAIVHPQPLRKILAFNLLGGGVRVCQMTAAIARAMQRPTGIAARAMRSGCRPPSAIASTTPAAGIMTASTSRKPAVCGISDHLHRCLLYTSPSPRDTR